MPTALEVELKTYAHNLVAIYTKYEYDNQISIWKDHINYLADGQKAAGIERHQGVLLEAKKHIEEQRAAAFGLAMMALSMIAGPALSWIAGKIQYKWFPKLAGKANLRVEYVLEHPEDISFKEQQVLDLKDHDKVMAKVFGDIGKQVVGWGTDKAIHTVMGSSGAASSAMESAAASDEGSFKTNLEHALLSQAKITSDAIMGVGLSINENSGYGAECLQRLKNVNPRARDRNVTEKDLEFMAKQMIRDDINARRQEWVDREGWFFYGNNPGSTAGLAEAIERELWAMWILNESLQMRHKYGGAASMDDTPVYDIWWVEGKTFGDKGVPEEVLHRLADFGVVVGRTRQQKREESMRWEQEHDRQPSRGPVDDPWKKINEQRRQPQTPPSKVQVIDLDQQKRERERRDAEKQERIRGVLQRDLDRDGVHPGTEDRPVIDVGLAVDTQQEIDALENWAQHHRARMIAGQMTHTKRKLESIENIVPR